MGDTGVLTSAGMSLACPAFPTSKCSGVFRVLGYRGFPKSVVPFWGPPNFFRTTVFWCL